MNDADRTGSDTGSDTGGDAGGDEAWRWGAGESAPSVRSDEMSFRHAVAAMIGPTSAHDALEDPAP